MLFCAALLALAAPLRAGEAAWLTSADRGQIVQVPADWAAAAAVPGLTPRGIKHAFSLAPKSRAFVLDIGAEDALNPKAASAEDHFAKALKLAGNPPAQRVQLPDNSLYEYFKHAPAAKGRAGWRIEGVLHKYVQRYYLVFISARAYPGDKDWKDALRLLATLDPDEPSAGAWKDEFLQKVSGGGVDPSAAPAGGSLNLASAAREDGTSVSLEDIAIFGCKNFIGNLYLFNQDRTAHCWVVTMKDYRDILQKLDQRYWEDSTPYFQACPAAMRQERACDMEKLRRF